MDYNATHITGRYPTWFFDYFTQRGISLELIREAGAIPLTPTPDQQEIRWYATFRKASRLNGRGGLVNTERGIGFPYFVDKARYGDFGRERILQPTETLQQFFQEKGEDLPKYLSPSEKALLREAKEQNIRPSTSHLYILPAEAEKLRKTATRLCIIEGEAKTLALIQDLRALQNTAAAIGISGVEQLLSAPEASEISWKNRTVYLFFDADSRSNPNVGRAEIKAAAFLLARGARQCYSCVWNAKQGNGYDDLQVKNEQDGIARTSQLQRLFDKAVPTFRKYAPDDRDNGLPLKTYCEAIAKVPHLGHYKTVFVTELSKVFKAQGYKSKDIKDILDNEIDLAGQERRDQEREEHARRMQDLFGISYLPTFPKNFFPKDGKLYYFDTPLCNMFVIRKYISTDDPDRQDMYLLKFARDRKELEIPSDDFAKYQKLAQTFNRNQEILYDATAKKVQQYISEYWMLNQTHVTITQQLMNTGWLNETFYLPTITGDVEFERYIKDAFFLKGHAEIQAATLATWFRDAHPAMLQVLCGFCSPLIAPLNLQNFTVMVTGDPGGGKSTGGYVALSQFGFWEKLKFTMNTTGTGQEIICSMFKDLPVMLDETNTGGKDGAGIAQMVLETIYGWESGKGRARGTTNITLRKMNEYNGILFLTSERGLETILSVTRNMNVGGAYRRVLEIPATRPLWNYRPALEKQFFAGIYDSINSHFGHVGAAWLRQLSDPHTLHQITRRYKTHLKDFGTRWNLKGTDNLICLIYAILPDLEQLLDLPDGLILDHLGDFLEHVIKHNQTQIEYYVKDSLQRFLDALEAFMSENLRSFEGLGPREEFISNNYGKYIGPVDLEGTPLDDPDAPFDIWLRPEALEKICNAFGFNKQGVLDQLYRERMLDYTDRTIARPDGSQTIRPEFLIQKFYRGKNWKCYHLRLNYPDDDHTPSSETAQPEFALNPPGQEHRSPWA